MTAEYTCEGCGVHVVAVALEQAPAHGFCSVCEWFTAAWRTGGFADAAEMIEAMHLTGQLERGSSTTN